jgi:hypothetical protein
MTTAARRKAGAREVHVWLTAEDAALLDALGERWGLMSIRDTITTAIKTCHAKAREEDRDG